ncbi:MAG: type III-A CRISPR-associated protein Cas10/Csm1 [Sulfurovum sp.]|nr:type III-A CRISPR-associated protein Cas10/Csm1 [Sulfurovum sp.]
MNEIQSLALAGLLHDIGKFRQRSGEVLPENSYDLSAYCPFLQDKGYFTHQHAAHTAEFLKTVVAKQGDRYKFIEENIGDESFENISAKHHKPTKPKEWIVAMADRIASGFEREAFEKYNNADDRQREHLKYYEVPLDNFFDEKNIFALERFSSQSIYSSKREKLTKEAYAKLYKAFLLDIQELKKRPKENFESGLDFLLKKYTSFIPSSTYGTKANIPLYDHLKTTAAFASALAKYHEDDMNVENIKDYNTQKFLLIAGDFFGIQNFIFENLPTAKAAKILRGKSAFIQIFIKVVALDICKKLELSKLSVVSDNAGKFEILAANTEQTKAQIKDIQKELNEWFLHNTFGESGIGISFVEASGLDFTSGKFQALRERLAKQIELSKYKKFNLTGQKAVFEMETKDNAHLCKTCNKRFKNDTNSDKACEFCNIFIKLGEQLAKAESIQITHDAKGTIPIYGDYYAEFKSFIDADSEIVYDITNDETFRGYTKWALRSYVATTASEEGKKIVDFENLEKQSCGGGKEGVKALMSLKGDVDNMGSFLKERNIDSFAKFNFISRLIDYFFSVKVSQMMDGKNLYTVFAGGDDFFIMGAWDEVIEIAKEIRAEFLAFVAGCELSVSMGGVMFKSSKPINYIAQLSDEALEKAKALEGKDGISFFDESVKWDDYLDDSNGMFLFEEMNRVNVEVFKLNTAFSYRLLELVEMSKRIKEDPLNNMWQSKLRYSFSRNVLEKIPKEDEKRKKDLEGFLSLLNDIIGDLPHVSKMIMSEFIYKRREL